MKQLPRTTIGLILCVRALAQAPACTLSGTVAEPGGKPVAKARVLATGSSYSLWKTTDTAGFFCFDRLDPDTYRVSAGKTGYLTGQRRALVENGSTPNPLKLEISQSASLSGTVVDSDGDPLPGATVALWTRGGQVFVPNNQDNNDTGPDGAFRFAGLAPGTYYLSATHRDGQERRYSFPFLNNHGQANREIEMETFYSGSLTFADAAPLTVKTGQQITRLVLMVRKSATRRLSGRVEAPLPGAFLVLNAATETSTVGVGGVPIGKDGLFVRDGLAPAVYTLLLRNGNRTLAKKRVDLTPADADGIVLEPVETMDVTMTFRTEHDAPPFHPFLRATFLIPKDSGDTFDAFMGRPGPDDTVRFNDVAPGDLFPATAGRRSEVVRQKASRRSGARSRQSGGDRSNPESRCSANRRTC